MLASEFGLLLRHVVYLWQLWKAFSPQDADDDGTPHAARRSRAPRAQPTGWFNRDHAPLSQRRDHVVTELFTISRSWILHHHRIEI